MNLWLWFGIWSALCGTIWLAFRRIPTCPEPIYMVDVCPYCDEEVHRLPPDGIDYCQSCDIIVEGESIETLRIGE